MKGFGLPTERYSFDLGGSLVGKSVAYEFDVQIDNKVLPLKLMEYRECELIEASRFTHFLSRHEESEQVESRRLDHQMLVLAPVPVGWSNEIVDSGYEEYKDFTTGKFKLQ